MNKDEEVDADDLVSETDRTIRRDLEKFRRRLQERVQLAAATGYKKIQTFASHFPLKFFVFTHENNWICPWVFSLREIWVGMSCMGTYYVLNAYYVLYFTYNTLHTYRAKQG